MDKPLHLAGKLVGIDIPGHTLSDETKLHLEKYRFGGVCVFRKNIQSRQQLARLVQEIRELLPQAWISIDQEGGAVLRTSDLPDPPSAMALGAVGDAVLVEQVGAAAARGLISLGINWNYAPSLDVNINPANPVIGDRSFGCGPGKVAELGIAWAKGLQSQGVAAAVKHFPGHGDTHLDSHLDLPRVDKPRELLDQVELHPFRQAIQAGVASIMTTHIIYSALDPENPATLSKSILTGLLRQEWGYDGVVMTDSMGMKAITDNYPAGQAALRSVRAGADVVLALGKFETQIQQVEALTQAIESGEITAKRLEASYQRLDALAQQFPGKPKPYLAHQEARDRTLMNEVSYRSITAIGEVQLPNPADRILLIIPEAAGENFYEPGPQAEKLAQAMSRHFRHLEVLAFPREHPEFVRHELEKTAKHADFLLYASTSRHSLKSEEIALAKAVFQQGKPALHLALWNPYQVALLQPALVTYGFRQPSLDALADVLAGKPALGKLPVRLS